MLVHSSDKCEKIINIPLLDKYIGKMAKKSNKCEYYHCRYSSVKIGKLFDIHILYYLFFGHESYGFVSKTTVIESS